MVHYFNLHTNLFEINYIPESRGYLLMKVSSKPKPKSLGVDKQLKAPQHTQRASLELFPQCLEAVTVIKEAY